MEKQKKLEIEKQKLEIEKLKKEEILFKTDSINNKIYNDSIKKRGILYLNIEEAHLSNNSIGHPEVSIKVRNIGNFTIDAYDVEIHCYNRYGEPVLKYNSNICKGTSQNVLHKNKIDFSTWTLYGRELTTKVKIFLLRIHFTNGKTWLNPNKNITKIEAELNDESDATEHK